LLVIAGEMLELGSEEASLHRAAGREIAETGAIVPKTFVPGGKSEPTDTAPTANKAIKPVAATPIFAVFDISAIFCLRP
jgi:UDP-N-acetylmuramyl pentapeptide synthase